ncbi:uncharacterized protein LOC121746082 [Salvia splendens]|uniref:uncharacterized protein LOC121746082 n=1 Tax=Salvia splendens TaxID=180675 RepID=UPI001C257242|nr:uncharacterized protein LOC121746082 [Salvia splendens]
MEEGSRTTMFLSSCRKNLVVQFLLKHSIDGVLTRGAVMEAAEEYGISRKTVYRLWNKAKQQMQRGEPAIMEGKVKGYHHSDKFSLDEEKVRALSTLERSSIRKMAHKLSVSKNTLGRVQFESMHNVVHIDEKWFYMTKTSDRPVFGLDGQTKFDGKLGIFPFTELVAAQRKSKNRAKGTLETKPISSVNKSVKRDCIINRIVPAIKAKWPEWASKEIYIQQDNATPHINGVDAEFEAVAKSDGFKIHLICQPPNSPDTNILDLGFFRAIQTLQHEKPCNNVDTLLENVCSSYEELSPQTLNKVFLSLQACLTEIMVFRGGNNYKVPHINKARLERTVGLPNALDVDEDLVRDVLEYLQQPENNAGCGYDIMALANAFGF